MRTLKKLLVYLLLLAAIAGTAYYYGNKYLLNYQLNRFVKPVVTAWVESGWEKETISGHANSDLKTWLASPQSDALLTSLRELGALKSYEGIVKTKDTSQDAQISYLVKVKFVTEKGPIMLNIGLVWLEGNWKVSGFEGEALMAP